MTLQQLIDRLEEIQAEIGPNETGSGLMIDPKVLIDSPRDSDGCYGEAIDVRFGFDCQLVIVSN